jgi:hypothetical protein
MSLFVHTRAGNAVRRPLGGWSRFLATGALCLGLAACGGGGGGGDTASTQPASGLVLTVVDDKYGATIADATVVAMVGSSPLTVAEGPNGTYLLTGAVGEASVTVSRDTFVTQTVPATITTGATALTVRLKRATMAAGGSLTSRGNLPVVHSPTRMTFEIELVIVGADSQAIENLTINDFALQACTPRPAPSSEEPNTVDCVRAAGKPDVGYTPDNEIPSTFLLRGGDTHRDYAVALMLDQSASIIRSDPTDARLYSAKEFLRELGTGDWVLLSAFADQAGAKIPTIPLTVYEQFKHSSAGMSYDPTLDSLANQVGGGTPLYAALDLLSARVASDVDNINIDPPSANGKSVVIFTDGDDTNCVNQLDLNDLTLCRTNRQNSIKTASDKQVRIFTIGLSNNVDFEALGELANQTGGAFLFAERAEQLIPLYGSVGRLLSLNQKTYRLSWTVTSQDDVFVSGKGNALLGKVQVKTADGTFLVPFIVGIP